METINKICIIIIFGIICFIVSFYIVNKNNNKINYNKIIVPDTICNKVIFDSIEYNIHIKDSTIVEFKKKAKYEMEQAINANDSDAIIQFYELAGTN